MKAEVVLPSEALSQYHILRLPPDGLASVSLEYQNKRFEIFRCGHSLDSALLFIADNSAGITALVDLNRYISQAKPTSQPVLVSIVYPFQ